MSNPVKFNLRLPPDLHQQAAETAQAMGISLNAFTVLALRNWTQYQARQLDQAQAMGRTKRPALPATKRPASPPSKPATWGKVGRNEPCPCGSGRKFKQCHGGPM
ncbi:MAG: toxin-antitoxin system HicB family antitoxin [Gammaproteobacteria bacterium]|nr:toxin-antitoxin system HicB family antitoxin [Gammaproteobacteria bacterium]